MSPVGPATQLLRASSEGNRAAEERLIPVICDELRCVAGSYVRPERPDHTFLPVESNSKSSMHFLGVAARQMRRILVDHARRHEAAKRAGDESGVSFEAGRFARNWPRREVHKAL